MEPNFATFLITLTALSVFVEGTVEYFFDFIKKTQLKKYVALVLGVAACLAYGMDLFAFLGLVSPFPYVGAVFTGLVIGRGSNYLNDFISRVRDRQPQVVIPTENVETMQVAAPPAAEEPAGVSTRI